MQKEVIDSSKLEPHGEDRDGTARRIGTTLLTAYVGLVIGIFLVNLVFRFEPASENQESWFALFKDSLLLLGASLTTVIGYYFGQRDSEQARQQAQLSQHAAKKAQAETAAKDEEMQKVEKEKAQALEEARETERKLAEAWRSAAEAANIPPDEAEKLQSADFKEAKQFLPRKK